MAIVKKAGYNGLIYVSGNHIEGANAWEITVDQGAAEGRAFGQQWMDRVPIGNDWSGSITAWHDQDSKHLYNACVGNAAAAILLYPDRADLTTYWSGNAIFSFGSSADMESLVGQTATFTGAGSLAATGFSA